MVTFTNQVSIACDTQGEFDLVLARAQNYTPGTGEPAMSNLTSDAGTRTVSYTMTMQGDAS